MIGLFAPGFGEPVTVHRPADDAPRDRWGNLRLASSFEVPGCAVAPQVSRSARSSTEAASENADTVTSAKFLYCPPGTDIRADDVIELSDGSRWDVDGDPDRWRDPWAAGAEIGVQVRLTQSRG